ncbi:hypothetical protein GDO78_009006 [Eleutherodactylus coqui]|uniref:Uncharacterized protein n=1 Tax=Eleutherodactylus coqui TaxID=57060 RepID=A0A8J6K9Z4_ELECQ|nr:hypothetical protein GDO78_009006 [Eleutherodactylus coqui]
MFQSTFIFEWSVELPPLHLWREPRGPGGLSHDLCSALQPNSQPYCCSSPGLLGLVVASSWGAAVHWICAMVRTGRFFTTRRYRHRGAYHIKTRTIVTNKLCFSSLSHKH